MKVLIDTHIALWALIMLDSLKRPDSAPKHNDPFDRLLICQSKTEGMKFLTHDSLLPAYDEGCILYV